MSNSAECERALAILQKYYPNIEIDESDNYYKLPSFCHNLDVHHPDKNLVLYKDSGLFTCFSQCSSTFNIFTLMKKRERLEGRKILEFIPKQQSIVNEKEELLKDTLQKIQNFYKTREYTLPPLNKNLLQVYKKADVLNPWFIEGIDIEVLREFNIGYSLEDNAVIIPHFDFQNNLVGIRRRTYNPTEVGTAKYMPWRYAGQFFTHPLSLNLYGIHQNMYECIKSKIVILVESEKAVLQARSSFNLKNVLAVCGSNISNYQTNFIVKFLQPELVIIGFDKEYRNEDEKYKYYTLLKKKTELLNNFCNVEILMDVKDSFDYKESPFDRDVLSFQSMERWNF